MTAEQIQAIADKCHECGYDFQLALRTAARDGVPYYRTPAESFESQRDRAMAREVAGRP